MEEVKGTLGKEPLAVSIVKRSGQAIMPSSHFEGGTGVQVVLEGVLADKVVPGGVPRRTDIPLSWGQSYQSPSWYPMERGTLLRVLPGHTCTPLETQRPAFSRFLRLGDLPGQGGWRSAKGMRPLVDRR